MAILAAGFRPFKARRDAMDRPNCKQFVAAIALCLIAGGGCARLELSKEPNSPLPLTTLPADSIVLETCVAMFPWGAPFLNEGLWNQVDETRLDWSVRAKCAANGLRVGVIPGHAPEDVVRFLRESEKGAVQEGLTLKFEDASVEQTAETRHRQVRSGQRFEIALGDARVSETVFFHESADNITGETYQQAQYVLNGKVDLVDSGSVRLQLTPELQYGEASLRPVALGAGLSWQSGRDRKVFHELRMDMELQPGEILVVSCDPEKQASVGGRAFRAGDEEIPQQRIVLIRLTQTQHDENFDDRVEEEGQPTIEELAAEEDEGGFGAN